MKIIPRDYQAETSQSFWTYFANGGTGNPVAALPTGTGKSIVIAAFLEEVFHAFPNQKIMILTHVQELIEQNHEKLMTLWPTAPAGIYSAGLNSKDTDQKIIFGGIQSVAKKPELFGHVDLIMIDECHLVSQNADTSYRKFIGKLKEKNPRLKVLGLTATPYRLGLGLITDGGMFTDICIDLTGPEPFNRFVEEGYLARLVPKRTNMQLDVDNVKKRGGEFIEKDLQDAVDKEEVTFAAVQEIVEQGHDRDHWLIFATGIEHAEHITEMLDTLGIPAAVLHSKLTREQRKQTIADFKAGKFRALVNNNILTTGFDFAAIDLIGVIRPTNSPGLWVQILGRGTRPVYAPGFDLTTIEGRLAAIEAGPKQDCLVLDFAGNTARLGPINDPMIPQKPGKKKGNQGPPVRLCEKCSCYSHASKRQCEHCGEEFPIQIKFTASAGSKDLMAKTEAKIEMFMVNKVTYQRHKKEGRPDSIRVSYHCGSRLFNTFVCLEHQGFAARKAHQWWITHTKTIPTPTTTDEGLELVTHLRQPGTIKVWVNKKYPEILEYLFNEDLTNVSEAERFFASH